MTRNNRIFYLKQRESGVVMTATLKDATNTAIDLTGWTGQLIVAKQGTATIIDDPVTVLNQVTNRGEITYTFSLADSDQPAGKYDLEIVMTAPNASVHKFPKTEKGDFGSLVILASK